MVIILTTLQLSLLPTILLQLSIEHTFPHFQLHIVCLGKIYYGIKLCNITNH
jgi:hypothetical protein